MLSNIILGVIAIFSPLVCVWAFKEGMKVNKTENRQKVKIKRRRKKKDPAQEANLRRMNTLIANIANYDGSSNGQEKIK